MMSRGGLSVALRLAGRAARAKMSTTRRGEPAAALRVTTKRKPPPVAFASMSLVPFSTASASSSTSSRAQEGHRPWDNLAMVRRQEQQAAAAVVVSPAAASPPPTPLSMDLHPHHQVILNDPTNSNSGMTVAAESVATMTAAAPPIIMPVDGMDQQQGGAGSGDDRPRTSVLMELTDRVGVLHDVLRYFWKFDVNVCRIESRPAKSTSSTSSRTFDFFVDFEGSLDEPNVKDLMESLRGMTTKLLVLDEKQVHWFPRHISELDHVANRILEAGTDLEADHPGFHDPVYRSRRSQLAINAMNHRYDQPIPRIDYTPEELSVWTAVWDKMQELWSNYACKEYLASLQLMKDHCGYRRDNIPQQADINDFLLRRTGVRLRPVAGLLSSRDFLNGLAFRVFFCTQYIRHESRPLYTPEPDICHELLGHVPMFADHDFADFSQEIGLASLGASDDDVDKLARCYWHSVEFGLCLEDNVPKAYGAGLLSSFGELEYACSPDHPGADKPPTVVPWDPAVAAKTTFPITTYQPTYFCADSLQSAKDLMRDYCQELPRPFYATWNPQACSIHIDRPVRRSKGPAPPIAAAMAKQEDDVAVVG